MSAILAVTAPDGGLPPDEVVHRMLDAMSRRGTGRRVIRRTGRALLAVGRAEWETDRGFAGPAEIAEDDGILVAADATLYYRSDLVARLRSAGVTPRSDTPTHLIAAAYRSWGDQLVERLEGEWSFLVWDARDDRLLASRHLLGGRPLFHAQIGEVVVVASCIEAILAFPGCPDELHMPAVAATAAGLFGYSRQTVYRAIRRAPAGSTLQWRREHVSVAHEWQPPEVTADRRPEAEAAEELRALLTAASAQRMESAGPTTVWLSGGHDSTAVFGAAASHAQTAGTALEAVSVSYPPGDSGREDEIIRAVADHWGRTVHFIDIRDIPFLKDPVEAAGRRTEPFAHAFEFWNRALAAASAHVGAHLAFTGYGGDALFKTSPVYLADLLRKGSLRRLSREWRANARLRGHRDFFRWAVQPLLPPPLLSLARVLRRGRPLHHYLDRVPPEWIRADFLEQHQVIELDRADTRVVHGHNAADRELLWYLLHPYAPLVYGAVCALALEEGVEVRAPLLDDRVLAFILARPVSDRASGGETKHILRRAVRPFLPPSLATDRPKSGTTATFFDSSMRQTHARLLEEILASPQLADAGVVEPHLLRTRTAEYLRTGRPDLGYHLFLTLQTELWLREHHATSHESGARP